MLTIPNIIKNVESEITSKGFKELKTETIMNLFYNVNSFTDWLNKNNFFISYEDIDNYNSILHNGNIKIRKI